MSELAFPARGLGHLPFSTADVREQCAIFGDAPLAHPLPVKHLLMMCTALDELRTELATTRERLRFWVGDQL